jgi:hypothetical protein
MSSGHNSGEKAPAFTKPLTICATSSWLLGDTPLQTQKRVVRLGVGQGPGAQPVLTQPAKVFQGISHMLSPTLQPTGLKVTHRQNPSLTSQENRGWRMGQWGAGVESPHCSTHGPGPASVSVAARGSFANRHCFLSVQLFQWEETTGMFLLNHWNEG